MAFRPPMPKPAANLIASTLFFACALGLAVVLQYAGGALGSELGGYPDEAAHAVTGLMVRDYLSHWPWDNPLAFAQRYYDHYPKVALGHWPPFFYAVQAAWTLVFSPTPTALLLLMAVITAALASVVQVVAARDFGYVLSYAVGLMLVAMPLVQEATGQLLMDVLTALLMTLAALAIGRYLNHGGVRAAMIAGALAGLALLTKQNALALCITAPLGMLLARRVQRLRQWSLWCGIGTAALLALPWYLLTWRLVAPSLPPDDDLPGRLVRTGAFYGSVLWHAPGWALALLALVGFVTRVLGPAWRGASDGRWAALGAQPLALWAFSALIPAYEERYMVPALPALLLLAAAGLAWCSAGVARLGGARVGSAGAHVVVATAAVAAFGLQRIAVVPKDFRGFAAAAAAVTDRVVPPNGVVLIASDSRGEGVFTYEVALRELRPGRRILRASKVLSASGWGGEDYRVLADTPAAALELLAKAGVGCVVVDRSVPRARQRPDLELIEATMRAANWTEVERYPVRRRGKLSPAGLTMYRAPAELQVTAQTEP
jgi:4-amino-4-deoxy-L-arabinose transferase-like glycosyltransferase